MTTVSPTSAPLTAAAVDRSCRVPVLALFAFASLWLLVGLLLNLLAAIKFHSPSFLVSSAWQTYGRVFPAGMSALLYGFALQAGTGVGLWMVARLGRTSLRGALPATVAAIFWNFAVFTGVIAILGGGASGHEWLEMPRAPATILFAAFVVIALCGLTTFRYRQPGGLYVSNWFVITAFFWFAWVYAAGNLLLNVFPTRGVMQAVVGWWYLTNLSGVVLSFFGLAALLYFLPQLSRCPLPSQLLAAMVFWMVAILAPWTGLAPGTPLPAWMPAVSTLFSALLVIPAVSLAALIRQTRSATGEADANRRFFTFAAWAWIAWVLLGAVSAIREVSFILNFTWFVRGQTLLFIYGFLLLALLGAMGQVANALLGGFTPLCSRTHRLTFLLATGGSLVAVIPLLLGGWLEGQAQANPLTAFLDASKRGLMPLRLSTLGDLFVLVAALLFAGNLLFAVGRALVQTLRPLCAALTKPREVVRA